MAKITTRQKAHRVLKLLLGLHSPRVLGPLASRGFEEEDAEEGWRLLRGVAKLRADALPAPKGDPSLLVKLDEWENTWFPLAEATLERRFPAVHKRVFLNLSQTEGPAVIISVGTFVDRVTPLRDGDEESQKAAKLLARRGLNESVLMQARSLLAQLGNTVPEEAAPPDLEARRKETRAAEAELWAWYLEWSQIARGVITDRRLLRELGLRDGGRDGTAEDEAEPDEVVDDAGAAPTGMPEGQRGKRKR
jgi:hypothetical protein